MTSAKARLKKLVKEAEEATASVTDPALRAAAMQTVLTHLLSSTDGEVTNRPDSTPHRQSKARKGRSASKGKQGPKTWLKDMIDEGFFKKPRTSQEILDQLAKSGHHLKHADISRQLQSLTRSKKLRRNKSPKSKEKRQVWLYSNW